MSENRRKRNTSRDFDPPRPANEWERAMLELIATQLPADWRAALRRQILVATVNRECGCGCLTADLGVPRDPVFQIPGAPSGMQYGLAGVDRDGMHMMALLFLRDGYLASLEVLRSDSSPFEHQPGPWRFLDEAANLELSRRYWEGQELDPSAVEEKVMREQAALDEARRNLTWIAGDLDEDHVLDVTLNSAGGTPDEGGA
jgi:hypothetical protein